jgi:hypothetical protein
MYKILKIALLVIGVIAAIVSLFFMPDGEDPNAINSGAISFVFIITWILLIVAAALALFFGLAKTITSPGGLKRALIAIGGLAVVVAIGYGLSSSDEADAVVKSMSEVANIDTTATVVKRVGMLLNVFFIMLFVAVALMLWGGVRKSFAK